MGQILVFAGILAVLVGAILFIIDSITYRSRQKKMLEEIEKEYK